MNGRYERLILDLEPWLRGYLREKGVPGYLKALGNEAEVESEGESEDEAGGGAEGEAADVRAEVMKKALSVARDIESGDLRAPAKPEQYFKQVMRYALMDYFRTHPKTPGPSPDKRVEIDNQLYSIDSDEGEEGFSALPGIHVPPGPRAPAQPRRPALLTLARQRFWGKPAVSAEYERVQQRLDAISSEHCRQVVLLDLQGYRQEQIAAKVLRTQQAVSKALREQYAAWGWGDERVEVVRWLMAYANLVRLFGRVFPDGDFVFPRPRRQGFWADDLDFKEEEFDLKEDPPEHQPALPWLEELGRIHKGPFELPRDEAAYNRSRQPDHILLGDFDEFKEDLDKVERDRNEWWKQGRQKESKERRQRQEKLNRLKAQEAMLYRAIMNDPALAQWTKDLKLRHMPQLTSLMMGDDMSPFFTSMWRDDYFEDDDDWLRP